MEYYLVSSDSQINKLQCGHPKRTELLDTNIDTAAQRPCGYKMTSQVYLTLTVTFRAIKYRLTGISIVYEII